MNGFSGICLMVLCLGVICSMGCTQQPEMPEVTQEQTPAPVIPTTTGTPVILPLKIPATTTPAVTATQTIPKKTDAADVTGIRFLRYTDRDFGVYYPSDWNITRSTYTPYYCKNNLITDSPVYRVCYKNETRYLGPFNFYEDGSLKKQRRIVTFTSADGTLKFVAFTADFFDGLDGTVMLNPTYEWTTTQFEKNYPDLTGYAAKYVGNYQFLKGGNTMTASYDVTMTDGSLYYPAAYTKRTVVTPHHVYSFAFITDIKQFNTCQNLKEYLFSSITINDTV
jgi:hypothetical protein